MLIDSLGVCRGAYDAFLEALSTSNKGCRLCCCCFVVVVVVVVVAVVVFYRTVVNIGVDGVTK